jgi:glucose uptake protein
MLLPNTYAVTLALLLLSAICWGAWASTFKKSGWRFELYYFDFSIGAVLAALIAAFSVGSMGPDLSVQDSFLIAAKRPIAIAFCSGVIFNLANMFLLGATHVAGMSVAFPIGLGLALIVGAIWNSFLLQTTGALNLYAGCAVVLGAVIVAAVAHGQIETLRRKIAAANAPPPEPAAPGRSRKAETPTGPSKFLGVWLAIAGGILMGCFYPVMTMGVGGELDLSNPFAVALVFSAGILFSTFIFNLYFLNLPVAGQPLSFFSYFTGSFGQHALGLLGGILWMTGACANFAAGAAQGDAKVGLAFSFALGQGAALIGLLTGLLIWKEFADASPATKRLLALVAVLLSIGLSSIATSTLP